MVEFSSPGLWNSGGGAGPDEGAPRRGGGQKNKGVETTPVSRKFPEMKGLTLLLGLLGGLLGGLLRGLLGGLLRSHCWCHLLSAESIDSAERRVLRWPSLEGRGPCAFGPAGCLGITIRIFRSLAVGWFKDLGVPVETAERVRTVSPFFFSERNCSEKFLLRASTFFLTRVPLFT